MYPTNGLVLGYSFVLGLLEGTPKGKQAFGSPDFWRIPKSTLSGQATPVPSKPVDQNPKKLSLALAVSEHTVVENTVLGPTSVTKRGPPSK